MNWLKKKLRGWLMPEYEKINLFMEEVDRAKHDLHLIDKNITFEQPVVFLGSLNSCKVDVKPTLKPEIILSKLEIPAGLMHTGNYGMIASCYFNQQEPATVKLQTSKPSKD